jgi:hypothetical protein
MVRSDVEKELDVVVLRTLGAAAAPPRSWRRSRRAVPEAREPDPVTICRVTVVGADAFGGEADARNWLDHCSRDEESRDREAARALRSVNRAVRAQRVAAADPYVHEVSAAQARQSKLGYGTGDELVEGRWSAAHTLPPSRRSRARRREMLAPQQEVAGILSGRRAAYPSEDLLLRARLDLDEGLMRQAALQLRVAVEVLEGELRDEGEGERGALPPLGQRPSLVHELADAALRGDLDEEQSASLAKAIEEFERAFRRRRHADR